MAKTENGTVTENVTAASAEAAVTETAAQMNGVRLFVERKVIKDKFGKPLKNASGGNMYEYVLPCTLRGKETKIDFAPRDNGGYEQLDNIFDINEKAELTITERKSETNSGKKMHTNVYTVRNVDEDGITWELSMRPQRDSDKAMLKTWLQILGVTVTIY